MRFNTHPVCDALQLVWHNTLAQVHIPDTAIGRHNILHAIAVDIHYAGICIAIVRKLRINIRETTSGRLVNVPVRALGIKNVHPSIEVVVGLYCILPVHTAHTRVQGGIPESGPFIWRNRPGAIEIHSVSTTDQVLQAITINITKQRVHTSGRRITICPVSRELGLRLVVYIMQIGPATYPVADRDRHQQVGYTIIVVVKDSLLIRNTNNFCIDCRIKPGCRIFVKMIG